MTEIVTLSMQNIRPSDENTQVTWFESLKAVYTLNTG